MYDPVNDGLLRGGLTLIVGVLVVVALICWLTVDVFGVDVSKPKPQITVWREGQYECIRLHGTHGATCRKVEYEQGQ